MLMNPYELNREIEKGQVRNLYLFSGEEQFLKEESLRRLKEKLIPPEMEAFNYNLLYGFDSDYGHITAAAQSFPMFAEKRLVVVKQTDEIEDRDLALLEEYLKNPSPFTVLTFVYNEAHAFWYSPMERGKTPETMEHKRKEFKLLQKYCTEVSFKRLSEDKVKTWIINYAKKHDYTISHEGVSYLIDLLGTDLTAIANELQKTSIGLGERRRIEVEDLEGSTGRLHYHPIYELTDAIGKKELARSLKILNRMIEDGVKPLSILNSLSRHLTKIANLKGKLGKVPSPMEAEKEFTSRARERLMRQADMFTQEDLASIFQYLSNIDIAYKTTSLKPQFLLENLLMELCQGKGVKIITLIR